VVDDRIVLERYDLSRVEPKSLIVCIGPTGSGKTVLGKDIAYHLRDRIPSAVVFSKTAPTNKEYKYTFPDIFVHPQFEPEVLEKFIKHRKTLWAYFKERNVNAIKKYNINSHILIIADDCLSDSKWTKNESTREMFYQGRHYDITFLFMMQYPLSIHPDERGQLKYVFLFPGDDPGIQDRYYENYCKGIFPDKKTFNKVMDKVSIRQGACLVVDRTVKTRNRFDKIFWYRAKIHDTFPFTCALAWDYHKKKYCCNWWHRDLKNSKKKREKGGIDVILED